MRHTTTRFRLVLALILALTIASGGTAVLAAPENFTQNLAVSAPAAPSFCSDLFFSEYIEGSSNNKALEIYNGTGAAVALDGMDYTVEYYNNGASTPTNVYTLTGTIAFGDVLVLAANQAVPEVLAQADVAFAFPSVTHFNGDDALVLKKAGTVIDSIGKVGERPSGQWGSGDASTQDNTIVRKLTVAGGDTNPSDAYDPAGEWNGFAQDTFTYLGSHTAECAGLQLLISEVVVTPTGGEFIEIYNPNTVSMDLSDVYLTDATFAGSSTYYYNIVTGLNAGGGSFTDFNARFPDGASIPAGAFQTVALAGSAAYSTTYGSLPTYELYEEVAASPDAVPDMREATPGSINKQGGLTNSSEPAILYRWDGLSDLVTDLDYVIWGNTTYAVDKTGVSMDGPDAYTATTTYLADTAIVSQTVVATGAHANGKSWQRKDMSEGAEIKSGGNGAAGHNETSEDLNNTFCENTVTPGAADNCPLPPLPNPFGVCADPTIVATRVNAAQGTGADSPLANTIVVLEGVVVGDFQSTTTELSGYFLQEEDAQADANPATSEGIFVYDNNFGVNVAVGDVVRVQGTVSEYSGQTQLSTIITATICSSTGITVTPAVIDLPVTAVTDLEAFEGMLITVPETLYVTELYTLGRYGEVWTSANARVMQPTQVITPGQPALDMQAANANARLLIDDGSSLSNPATVPFIAPDNIVRGGDTVTGLTGALGYGFNFYRVQPTGPITFTEANPRTAAPDVISGSLKVAAFNVLNYFNGDGQGGGFPTSRGANSAVEFDRQRTKIITAMLSIDADILGLMEIENDGYDPFSAIADLVGGLNAIAGTGVYTYVNPGTPVWGSDEIAVAMIYKPARVTPIGASAGITTGIFDQVTVSLNRQPLAQTFAQNSNGERVTVVVNHFKSKGSDCSAVGDLDQSDGQGNCNVTRTSAANELAAWLAMDPTGSGDPDFLVIGDLNSYAKEDPIMALQSAGYTDLARHFGGDSVYSYVFDGQWGTLDYSLANATLTSQVTGATVWHINADEGIFLDYNQEFNPAYVYSPDAYRSSDHDPVVVGLTLHTPKSVLGISKSVALTNNPVKPGDAITYTLVISNSGDAVATDVRITDTLPVGVIGNNVGVTQTIAAGESYTLTITGTVAQDVTASSTITNHAYYSHTSGNGEASAGFVIRPLYSIYLPMVFKP
ncbi:MAG: ExeM/NucH family extracellular endonuclease [Caldilineaceae bacterium]|nr:ExeM/NucH family extracellular endonuclease [Caldilineaceae bacterium]MBP8122246.1 ExeM/NucH family extracellular endonuclease [Caldilineaceae bacterium]